MSDEADELLYRALFDANSDALFVHDETGRILMVNARMCAMFRCTADEALALVVGDLSANEPPCTQVEAVAHVAQALREGACDFEWRSRRRDGDLFWCDVALRRFQLGGDRRVIACVRDIGLRKQMEEALRASEERFATIFHSISTMLAFTEPTQGRILDVNDSWLRFTGHARDDVIGKTGPELGLWPDLSQRDRIVRLLDAAGRAIDQEATLHLGNRTISAVVSAQQVTMRGSPYFLWEIRDLSERKQAEAESEQLRSQLMHAQKMESVARLTGGIAHDFNNILTVIRSCTEMLLEDVPRTDPMWETVVDAHSAADRAATLIRQLLAFSRRQVMQPCALDLNTVVADTEQFLRRLISEDIELLVILEPGIGLVHADPSQINQVLMNLAVNARDAMPGGGRLSIETHSIGRAEALRDLAPAQREPAPAERFIRLTVADSGLGIDADTLAHLFEPFFTTKPHGKGTGLGLSTAYGIVDQSGGWMTVESTTGVGSRFKVYLPEIGAGASPVAIALDLPATEGGSETILVAEDQPDVRRLTVRMLRRLGYQVLDADGGEAALSLAAAHTGRIDLLVTDMIMPGMSGRQLGDQLRARLPAMKVLFVSGYAEDVAVGHGLDGDMSAFLQKPFSPAALSRKVRDLLG